MANLKTSGPIGFAGLVETLRRAEELGPAGQALGYLGILLLGSGAAWACVQILTTHLYLLCIFPGLLCCLLSVLARPGGVLCLLPQGLQEFLLQNTLYDMCFEDTTFQNGMRKWGRMLLLTQLSAPTAGQVRAVTEGLDPAFVDSVFRRTFIHHLPVGLRSILLPTPRRRFIWPEASKEAKVVQASSRGFSTYGLPADLGGNNLTPQAIARLMREKLTARNRAITEPEIGPAVSALGMAGIRPLILSVLSTLFKRATQAMGAVSLCCLASALVLRLPPTRNLVLRLANVGMSWVVKFRGESSATTNAVTQVGRVAAGLGILGVGGMIAFLNLSQKLGRAGTDLRVAELETRLARQAEDHEEALARLAPAATSPGKRSKVEAESDASTADSTS